MIRARGWTLAVALAGLVGCSGDDAVDAGVVADGDWLPAPEALPDCAGMQAALGAFAEGLLLMDGYPQVAPDNGRSYGVTCAWQTRQLSDAAGPGEALEFVYRAGVYLIAINIDRHYGPSDRQAMAAMGLLHQDDRLRAANAYAVLMGKPGAPDERLGTVVVHVGKRAVQVGWGGPTILAGDDLAGVSTDEGIDNALAIHRMIAPPSGRP